MGVFWGNVGLFTCSLPPPRIAGGEQGVRDVRDTSSYEVEEDRSYAYTPSLLGVYPHDCSAYYPPPPIFGQRP